MLKRENGRGTPVSCGRIVVAVFGTLFLIAFLSVPCTKSTSSLRTDPYTQIVYRTTHPQNVRVFLPTYLSLKARPQKAPIVRIRSTEWTMTMAIIAVLGVFDYLAFCRVLRRKRLPRED
jgi:hypothetical protein